MPISVTVSYLVPGERAKSYLLCCNLSLAMALCISDSDKAMMMASYLKWSIENKHLFVLTLIFVLSDKPVFLH